MSNNTHSHSAEHRHPNYVLIWFVLVLFTIISIVLSKLLVPHAADLAILLLFVSAGIKATLVALNFMHLKFEKIWILALVIVPLIFFMFLIFGFMPDITATSKF